MKKKDLIKINILILIIILSIIWIIGITANNDGVVNRLNQCLKENDLDFCNEIVR